MRAVVSGLLIIIMIFTVILPMTVAAESENLVSGLTYTVKTSRYPNPMRIISKTASYSIPTAVSLPIR